MRIAFVPIDNRPVCYSLPLQIADISDDLELILPPREMLGDLTKTADIKGIFDWIKSLQDIDKFIISLDTIAYGGLIPSRRSSESFEDIKARVEKFREILLSKNSEIYAFSSIMRISDNNVNEEEKDYWNLYGKKIFKYSYESHKNAPKSYVQTDVPYEILQDYLKTRKRNFDINMLYLKWAKEGFFDTLVYSKDDCAKYGLNVAEAEALEFAINEYVNEKDSLVKDFNTLLNTTQSGDDGKIQSISDSEGCESDTSYLSKESISTNENKVCVSHCFGNNSDSADYKKNVNVFVKTGADEIPLSLLSRAVTAGKNIKIAPVFTEPDYIDKISKYEDVSVFDSVKGQIELAGCTVCNEEDSDIVLLVNNFREEQGELVMGVDVQGYCKLLTLPQKQFAIADIRYANGADNNFVASLFNQTLDYRFLGYAGWNTTGNTLGSVLCCALVKFITQIFNDKAFKKVQAVRFLDDWAYQANVRKILKSKYDVNFSKQAINDIKKEIEKFEKIVNKKLNSEFNEIAYKFPWDRSFEVEVIL